MGTTPVAVYYARSEVIRRNGNENEPRRAVRTLMWTGVIVGIGVVGTLDEVVLHQLLQWHNFYVHATARWRIVSDGLFHLFTAAMLWVGIARLWSQRSLIGNPGSGRAFAAGILLGMGGFNLYDGTIQHKLLGLHPVREGVPNQLPYDLVFIGIALLLFVIGWLLSRSVPSR